MTQGKVLTFQVAGKKMTLAAVSDKEKFFDAYVIDGEKRTQLSGEQAEDFHWQCLLGGGAMTSVVTLRLRLSGILLLSMFDALFF